ncbi:putative DNA-binding protein (MmcQ/YjbR family) [Algoriphagus sp. 4150]|uniref:MmcQ/YjbR family DNA-binding protein n=1 Tax=Algoriphagus sp. 4150 TaxID=2817756 RepID=UPI0028615FC9|nr:MmcQ/YjbR family DNA-binding protein [Algoriphagus sp. 4150]MDR7131353.1 putative DNA-binding protein (MmcQ/YjbR family) [Algoriphagus sp. 4150]
MISSESFAQMALSLPGTESAPHFDRTAFKVIKRRIFATFHEKSNSANLALSLEEQSAFCEYEPQAIYPVPNKWGEKGWTTFDLHKVSKEVLSEALTSAYSEITKHTSK